MGLTTRFLSQHLRARVGSRISRHLFEMEGKNFMASSISVVLNLTNKVKCSSIYLMFVVSRLTSLEIIYFSASVCKDIYFLNSRLIFQTTATFSPGTIAVITSAEHYIAMTAAAVSERERAAGFFQVHLS